MGQHTNRKTGQAMNEQNKISGCVCSGMLFAAVHESAVGTSRASRDVRLKSAKSARADIDRVAVTTRFYEYTAFCNGPP
jgi:hypothetical protein